MPATTPSEVEDARIPEPGSWESDVERRFDLNFVQPVMRELQQRPWSTSEAIGNRALGHKQIDNRIRTAADILHKKVKAGAVEIAWDTTGMPHYALADVARPGDLATQEQIDAAAGAFPCLQPSCPIESQSSQDAPPLVRPDRQFTFDGAPHYEWPKPEEDRDTITVDRLRDDIDGPSHRFLIRRGDTVEVFFRRDKMEVGEVVGISHANHAVRVRFGDRGAGIWFAVGQIYPAVEVSPEQGTTEPLSAIVEQVSQPPPAGFSEADRVGADGAAREPQGRAVDSLASNHRPYTLAAFREYRKRYEAGEATLAEHQAEFTRAHAARDQFIADLKTRSTH